jgi:succinate dehydrogenase / fumarate reductase cytochrome b subunit
MANGTNQPISPHLQVYRFHFTMAASIIHRITGVGLGLGSLLLSWWLIAAATGPEAYAVVQTVMGSLIGRLILLGYTWAIFYHLLCGIRFMVWDAGYALEIRNTKLGGQIVVVGSVILTALCWLIALKA